LGSRGSYERLLRIVVWIALTIAVVVVIVVSVLYGVSPT
jgi:hypothetical protein